MNAQKRKRSENKKMFAHESYIGAASDRAKIINSNNARTRPGAETSKSFS